MTQSVAFAKKDFKGLFGSYRREKFTENEGSNTSFGVDLMLSTLLPLTPIVKSSTDRSSSGEALNYATFFNVELNFFFTLYYNWELFANIAYYNYETRKETPSSDPTLPIFHLFEMDVTPAMLGLKYRFSTSDFVPYIGASGGLAYVKRKGFYDNNAVIYNEQHLTCFVGQVLAGVEFYFAPKAGIRLEASAHYMQLPEKVFDPGQQVTLAELPLLSYQSNPWSIRYASGLFFLF